MQRPFRLVGEREAAIAELVEEFISRGWVEPSVAGWSSPAFFVPKKLAGKWRMVDGGGLPVVERLHYG